MRPPRTLSAEALRALLARAEAEGADQRVRERLRWFLHLAERGTTVSATCRNFGIGRSTLYRWIHRFDPDDLGSLQDRPNEGGCPRAILPAGTTEPAGDLPSHTRPGLSVPASAVMQPLTVRPAAAPAGHAAGDDCALCKLQFLGWPALKSAAFVTSIVFNLALTSLVVFTAMLEGAPTDAKPPPDIILPAEQQSVGETSFLHSLLGIEIASAATGIYRPINYQGKLTNSGGVAISNGTYDLRFRLYDATSGGVPLWSETWSSATQKVTATGGLFSIALGTHTAMTGSVNFNSDNLFLQVEFDPGADGVFEEVFTPRRRFASVPYAHNADTLDGLDSTKFIRTDVSQTASGTLTISPRDASKTALDLLSTAGNVAALKISTQGANHIVFGTGAANYDTNLYRAAVSTLKTDGNFQVVGTLSGRLLTVSGNATLSGSLVVQKGISGATLEVLGTASGLNLFATQSVTGTHLYAATTFGGAGLADCDTAGSSKLLWDDTTKRFSCGTDQNSVEVGTASFSGAALRLGDARYVKKQGDTMTGALTISLSSGYLGLKVLQTASGAFVHAEKGLSSSGTLVVRGTTTLQSGAIISTAANRESIRLQDTTHSDSVSLYTGTGDPNATVSAQLGSVFFASDTGKIWKNNNGATQWVELTTGSGTVHMAQMRRAAAQTINDSTSTKIAFDTEVYDVGDIADAATNDRFTIRKSGKYLVTASWTPGAAMDAGEYVYAFIMKNGAQGDSAFEVGGGTNTLLNAQVTSVLDLVAGDYLEFYVYHTEGAAVNTYAVDTNYAPRMSVAQLDGIAGGGSSPWTDGGTLTYLTDTTDNVAIGAITAETKLEVVGTMSGKTLFITQGATFAGSGVIISATGSTVFNEQSRNVDFRIEGDTDSALFFLDASTDRVGIGTLSPETKLDVLGTISGSVIRAQNTLASSGALVVKKYAGTSTGNILIVDTAGLVYDASNKRVGVGTANPLATLDIRKGTDGEIARMYGGDSSGYLSFVEPTGNAYRGYIGYGDAGNILTNALSDSLSVRADAGLHLAAGSNAASYLTILNSGNVGIGTTSPAYKLDVRSGDIHTDRYLRIGSWTGYGTGTGSMWYDGAGGAGSSTGYLAFGHDGNTSMVLERTTGKVGIGTTTPVSKLHTVGAMPIFNAAGAATALHHLVIMDTDQGSSLKDWRPYQGNTTAALQIMTTAQRGVLIAPATSGNANFVTASGGLDIYTNAALGVNRGTHTMTLSGSKVGIGTTSPLNILTVKDASSTAIMNLTSGDTTLVDGDIVGQYGFRSIDADAHLGGDQVLGYMAGVIEDDNVSGSNFAGSAGEGLGLAFYTSGSRPSSNAAFTPAEAMRITKTGNVGIGTPSPSQKLTLSGGVIRVHASGTPLSLSGVNVTSADATASFVQGKYAYVGVTKASGNDFRVVDVSNPNKPAFVGGAEMGTGVNAVAVAGRYAYLGLSNGPGNEFHVVDVATPSAPKVLSGVHLEANVNGVAVAGRYAFLALSNSAAAEFRIVDVGNPFAPRTMSGVELGATARGVAVAGRYAYVATDSRSGNDVRVIDVGNPSAPSLVGGVDIGTNARAVAAAGRYLYVVNTGIAGTCSGVTLTGCEFRIYDVSNPASPAAVGGFDIGTATTDQLNTVVVSGYNAYVGGGATTTGGMSTPDIRILDIQNASAPAQVGSIEPNVSVYGLTVAGKYLYVSSGNGAGAGGSGNEFHVYDLPGIDAPTASIGTLGLQFLTVSNDVTIDNVLSVGTALNVGPGGIKSDGPLAVVVGSGGTVSNLTGAVIVNRGLTGAVLALDSSRGGGTDSRMANPHILFGYRGQFDTNLYRAGTGTLASSGSLLLRGGTGRTLLTLDTGMTSSAGANLLEVYSNVTTGFGAPHRNRVLRLDAAGSLYSDGSYNSGGADYAERFLSSTPDLKSGEAVCLDTRKAGTVKRCDRSGDPNVMGIVSTRPAFVGDKYQPGESALVTRTTAVVGLIGQLPARAVVEDGQAIAVGDALAAAAKPGSVRKARAGESTVGVALKGLASGSGEIEVLITRRNQSDLVEQIENEVTQSIADMHLEDDVRALVQTAMNGADIGGTVAAAVQAQVQSLNLAAQINAVLDQRLADGSLRVGSPGSLAGDVLAALRSDSGTDVIGNLVASRLALTRTGTAALVVGADLLVSGGLAVERDAFIGGRLRAAALEVTGGAVVDGSLTLNGPLVTGSGFVLGPLALTGGGVRIGSLAATGALQVLGPVTVDGIALFRSDVRVDGHLAVSGALVLNANQAGFAIIPAGGTGVTVRFDPPMTAAPVVTVTGDSFTPHRVRRATATGFTIEIPAPATGEITFAWHALASERPRTVRGSAPSAPQSTAFPVDERGVPLSTSAAWNACIRNQTLLDADGQPYSCARYHEDSRWTHPDLLIEFQWNPEDQPALALPSGYAAVPSAAPAGGEGEATDTESQEPPAQDAGITPEPAPPPEDAPLTSPGPEAEASPGESFTTEDVPQAPQEAAQPAPAPEEAPVPGDSQQPSSAEPSPEPTPSAADSPPANP